MSLAQRFERRLEGLVGGAFARVFKGQVEPVEIGTALQREASDKRNVMGSGQVLCPNRYRVTLSAQDHERLVPWEVQLCNSLAELVQEYLDENSWGTIGDIEVFMTRDDELHTGVFGVASRMEPGAPPRRRPHDSLSLPIIPGMSPGDYQDEPPADEQYGAWQQPVGAGVPGPPAAPAEAPPSYADQPYPDQPYADHPHSDQPPYPQQPSYAGQYAPPGPYQQPGYGPPAGYGSPYAQPGPSGYGSPYGAPAQAPPAPPPARQPAAMLIVDQSNRRFDLRAGNNVIGRGTDSDLQLLDQGISRRHVDIQYDGNAATAYDLGSTNGTTVNGHEITSQELRHGDVIRVGHTRIVFHQESR